MSEELNCSGWADETLEWEIIRLTNRIRLDRALLKALVRERANRQTLPQLPYADYDDPMITLPSGGMARQSELRDIANRENE